MGTFEIMGVTTGYLFFRGNGRKPQLRHYNEVFFVGYLTKVQDSHPGLIPRELEVGCEYCLGRSGRCGLATHLRNKGVKPDDIEVHQMWRKTALNVGRNFKVNGTLCYSITLICCRACPLCYVVQVRFEGERKTVGNQAAMDLLSMISARCKEKLVLE